MPATPDVLLATCAELPDGDGDDAALVAELERCGLAARFAVWTDPDVDWDDAFVVLRSVWDYPAQLERFLSWMTRLAHVANPVDVVTWNTDKVYLQELADAGVPIVPSAFAPPGATPQLPGYAEFVIKPSVGAGSFGAGRFGATALAEATEHVDTLHRAGRTALIQPYLADVENAGETALVYFDGAFSHAIRKGPMLGDAAHPLDSDGLYVIEKITARVPSRAELEVGQAALAVLRSRFGADQLYTRVDLLPGADGPVVIEVEVTEPSLFFGYADHDAAARFAAAIAARF